MDFKTEIITEKFLWQHSCNNNVNSILLALLTIKFHWFMFYPFNIDDHTQVFTIMSLHWYLRKIVWDHAKKQTGVFNFTVHN